MHNLGDRIDIVLSLNRKVVESTALRDTVSNKTIV